MSKTKKPMTKTFTENDLLKFVYDEMSETEIRELRTAIRNDINLYEKFIRLKEMAEKIDSFLMRAPDAAVRRIIYASKNMQSL